ncbi:MAG: Ig-like domain-containing protein, partial [Syntrophomonadaceae bacterium]
DGTALGPVVSKADFDNTGYYQGMASPNDVIVIYVDGVERYRGIPDVYTPPVVVTVSDVTYEARVANVNWYRFTVDKEYNNVQIKATDGTALGPVVSKADFDNTGYYQGMASPNDVIVIYVDGVERYRGTPDVYSTTVQVTGVSLDNNSLNLTAGAAAGNLVATVTPDNATNKNVTWSSSNNSVATVADGVVTPVAAGTATITVTTVDGNFTADCVVTVNAATVDVSGVSLNASTLTLTEGGDTAALVATVTPADATNKNVTWSSSNNSVATVDNGVVTPVAAGSATITVTTADGGFTADCVVTVNAATVNVSGVSLNASTLTLTEGGDIAVLTATVTPADATNQNVTWSSSNNSVATVANGVVTPVAAGSATITVTTADGGFTADCVVTVNAATVDVSGVSLNTDTLTLTAGGDTAVLTATVTPADATNQNVIWSSSNESVATVNDSGVVTPVAAGTATITVTTADGGFTANCVVTVAPVPVTVTNVEVDASNWAYNRFYFEVSGNYQSIEMKSPVLGTTLKTVTRAEFESQGYVQMVKTMNNSIVICIDGVEKYRGTPVAH